MGHEFAVPYFMAIGITIQLTDRRRKRALAANPASDESGAFEAERQRRFGAAARWAVSRNQGVFSALGSNLAGE